MMKYLVILCVTFTLSCTPVCSQVPTNCTITQHKLDCRNRAFMLIPDLSNLSSSITDVDFSFNWIDSINYIKLPQDNQVKSISLQYNRIFFVEEGSFMNLKYLTHLDLSGNGLYGSAINTTKFSGMPNLQNLSLAGNPVTRLTDLAAAFADYGKLEILDLSNCSLSEVTADALDGLSALRILDLSNNNMADITQWAKLKFESLEEAFLSNNSIMNLHASSFAKCPMLQNLFLDSNGITEFPDLAKITASRLDLRFNKIKTISFGKPRNLTAPRLRTLYVSHNLIENIGEDIPPELYDLNDLDLSYNLLQNITKSTFSKLWKLLEVSLSYNKIDSITGEAVFPPNLAALTLNGNNIQEIPLDVLASLNLLYILDLSNNPLTSIHAIPRPIEGLSIKVKWVSMDNMPNLQTVTQLGFRFFPNMQVIHMSNNSKLTEIEDNAFPPTLQSLFTVIMRNNSLTYIPEHMMDWDNLEKLDFTGNPFVCDVKFCWMLKRRDAFVAYSDTIR